MWWSKVNKNLLFYVIVIIVSVPAILPFFNAGFLVTDDGGWMVIRLSAFYDTLRDGQIPTRFLERLYFNYSYPVSNFLYPGFLYLGSLIHLVGFGFITTIKILFAASLLLSGVFCYLWLRRLFNHLDSFIGSVVYLYTPYHLFDVYKRGSLGECLSLAILPLSLWSVEKSNRIVLAVSVLLILIFHNTLALFFIPIIIVYSVVRKKFLGSLFGIVLGGLMSSFFTIPAIWELRYTKFSQTPISNPLEYFASWDLVGLGSLFILISAVAIPLVIYRTRVVRAPFIGPALVFFIISLFSIVTSTNISESIWESVNSSFVQFPYRFLTILLIAISFLAAFSSFYLTRYKKSVFISIVLGFLIFSSISYFSNLKYDFFPDDYYSTNESTTTVHDEYLPIWVKEKATSRPLDKIEIIDGTAQISNLEINSSLIKFNTVVTSTSTARVNVVYWPGWKLHIDNEVRNISYDNDLGVMEFRLEEFDNQVHLQFSEDTLRNISNVISLGAALVLVYSVSRRFLKF